MNVLAATIPNPGGGPRARLKTGTQAPRKTRRRRATPASSPISPITNGRPRPARLNGTRPDAPHPAASRDPHTRAIARPTVRAHRGDAPTARRELQAPRRARRFDTEHPADGVDASLITTRLPIAHTADDSRGFPPAPGSSRRAAAEVEAEHAASADG